MRRPALAILSAVALCAVLVPGAAASTDFTYQSSPPAPFTDSRTYVLHGTRTAEGNCSYKYPDVHVPKGTTRWEVRALGINPATCTMLVEEGVPTTSDLPIPKNQMSAPVGPAIAPPAIDTVSSVASGYTSAWYEDAAGIHVTQDTTYISWNYTGSCVSGGSSSGQWSWDSLFTLVSHGGTNSYNGCSYFLGDTWSTMKTISLPCPWTTVWTYYYHIRSYGWKDGSFGASHDDNWAQNGCVLPLWPHWGYAKTG